jgi:hypothetical protein
MRRFISLTVFLVVVLGLLLHFSIEIPWMTEWMGKLPGDMVIRRGGIVLYFPIVTSAVISLLLSCVLSTLFGKEK